MDFIFHVGVDRHWFSCGSRLRTKQIAGLWGSVGGEQWLGIFFCSPLLSLLCVARQENQCWSAADLTTIRKIQGQCSTHQM